MVSLNGEISILASTQFLVAGPELPAAPSVVRSNRTPLTSISLTEALTIVVPTTAELSVTEHEPVPPAVKQLIKAYEELDAPVIAGVRIAKGDLSKYGIADVVLVRDNIFKINEIVEKPKPDEAPSDLATHGNYIFTPDIFEILSKLKPSRSGS